MDSGWGWIGKFFLRRSSSSVEMWSLWELRFVLFVDLGECSFNNGGGDWCDGEEEENRERESVSYNKFTPS